MPSRLLTEYEFFKLKSRSLGERLRFFREEVGKLHSKKEYTTKAMGQRLGITPQSITAIERGDTKNPSYQLIYKLTKDLNVPFEALSDEFYQGEVHLFPLGFSDDKPDPERDSPESSDFSQFYFGCYVYQLFPDGKMRFVYNKDTVQPIDYKKFIESLSRFINEIEVLNQPDSILDQSSSPSIVPLQQATSLFKASIENPKAFPKIPQHEFNKLLKELITRYEEGEGEL